MASRKSAKKSTKRRRDAEWMWFWAAAFGIVLAAAAFLSPLTRITVVRVTGAAPHDQARIEAALRTLAKTPALRVDTEAFEASLITPEVRSASLQTNAFGRARLSLVYRNPVASMPGRLAVDGMGNVFPLGERLAPNLQISQKLEDFSTILTISDPSPLRRLARLAEKLQVSMPKLAGTLEIDDKESLCLRVDGLVVEFGDTSQLDRKVQVLADLFQEEPQRAAEGGRIILVDPNNAVQSH